MRNVTTDVSALTEAFYVFYAIHIHVYFEQRDGDRRLATHTYTAVCVCVRGLQLSARRILVHLCGLANTFIQILREHNATGTRTRFASTCVNYDVAHLIGLPLTRQNVE